MLLDINEIEDIPNIQEAISLNREIVVFFDNIFQDADIVSIDSPCPDGVSFSEHIYMLARTLQSTMNLGALFHRLVKFFGSKKVAGDVDSFYRGLLLIIVREKSHILWQNWDATSVGNTLHGLQNSSNVPVELLLALIDEVPRIHIWTAQNIGMALYGLQNSSNIPTELLRAFAQVIPRVQYWNAQGIGNAIYGISHLKGGAADDLIELLFEKIHLLDIEKERFAQIQSLVIGLNHASIEIPEGVQSRWDDLVNTEGKYYSTTTKHERKLMKYIKGNFGEDFEFLGGAYVQGYEIDILILDSKGQIFAIIESDGGAHNNITKKNKDGKRDQYFLREGVTDLVIRVSASGCRIIETKN